MTNLIAKVEDGLRTLPYNELVKRSAAHMQREGTWAPGVLRPSLLAMECRLARVKTFLGHAPQPEAKFDHARQGEPDPASNLVMARGAWLEGVVVTALEAAGIESVMRSPDAVRWAQVALSNGAWEPAGWRFECHPDLIIGPRARPVQVKCPSDRALSYFLDGRREMVLGRYGTQILAELYIMELAGWEPEGASLLLVSAEPWPPAARRMGDPVIRAFEIEFSWGDPQRAAIQARIDETKADIEAAREGRWPTPLPLEKANAWPCSYCPFPRIPTLTARASCDNHQAWEAPTAMHLRVVGS